MKKGHCKSEVIIITGYGSFESYREAELSGVFEFICKPFRMADICRLIKKAARRARKKTEKYRQNAILVNESDILYKV